MKRVKDTGYNIFRQQYSSMSFEELQGYYRSWHKTDPLAKPAYKLQYLRGFLNTLPIETETILELGGGDGSLANEILPHYNFKNWYNLDLALPSSKCSDKRYTAIELTDFPYKRSLLSYLPVIPQVLIGSHIIEHMKFIELAQMLACLIHFPSFIYFEVWLPRNTWNHKWVDYPAPHVLEVGWNQISNMLSTFGYHQCYKVDSLSGREAEGYQYEKNPSLR